MAELDGRRLEVCLANHQGAEGVPGDLRETWEQVVRKYEQRESFDGTSVTAESGPALLAACPPCQGMSSARSGLGRGDDANAGSRDSRNLLVEVVACVATAIRPQVVVVENVPQFLTRKVWHPDRKDTPIAAARLLVDRLRDQYQVFPVVTDLADYGVPQTRRRAFLTFIRRDLPAYELLVTAGRTPYPIPTHATDHGGQAPISIGERLKELGLPSLDARSRETARSEGFERLHEVPVWTDRRHPMVEAIPAHSGRSAWENDSCPSCGPVAGLTPDDVRCPNCEQPLLRPVVREEDGGVRFVKGFRNSSYRRMNPDQPAATITTASGHLGSDLTVHPWETRLLSTLECARLQTFPEDFKWGDAVQRWGHTNVREMIGEAVPPQFTKMHGQVLVSLLNGTAEPQQLLPVTDLRRVRSCHKLGLPIQKQLELSVYADS